MYIIVHTDTKSSPQYQIPSKYGKNEILESEFPKCILKKSQRENNFLAFMNNHCNILLPVQKKVLISLTS
jgi:hypothetical protein